MTDRKYFTFLKSYADIYSQLNDEQKVRFIDAIIEHQLGDLDPEDVDFEDALLNIAWSGVKPSLTRSKAQYLNGKKPKVSQTQAKSKPKFSNKEIRSKKKEVRNRNKEDINAFVPNDASKAAVNSVYPNASIEDLVIDFIDQAKNRKQPFKDLQSGFRNYVRKGWVKPTEKSEKSFSQMAMESDSPWGDDGKLIGLEDITL